MAPLPDERRTQAWCSRSRADGAHSLRAVLVAARSDDLLRPADTAAEFFAWCLTVARTCVAPEHRRVFWCDTYRRGIINRRQASIAIDKLAHASRDRVVPELEVGTRDIRVGVNRWDQDRQDCESGNRLIGGLLTNERWSTCLREACARLCDAATRCLSPR